MDKSKGVQIIYDICDNLSQDLLKYCLRSADSYAESRKCDTQTEFVYHNCIKHGNNIDVDILKYLKFKKN